MYKFLAVITASLMTVGAFAQTPAQAPMAPIAVKYVAPHHHAKKKVVHKKPKAGKRHMLKVRHVPVHKKHKHQI